MRRHGESVTVSIGIHVGSGGSVGLARTLAAIAAYTDQPYRICVLADGPDEATRAAIARMEGIEQSSTEERQGAPACFNRLIRNGASDVFVFLENGAEPGPGWLTRILSAFAKDPHCGLAGPSTNRAWNQQGVMPAGVSGPIDSGGSQRIPELSALVARRFGAACRTLEPLHSLSDFCYVATRAVVQAVGAADEGYGTGPCWEMDYNIRAQRAGFKGIWVCGAYVHRAPADTARATEERALFEAAKRRYQDKFCGLRLRGLKQSYREHCRGDACANFAPRDLIAIRPVAVAAAPPLPSGAPVTASVPLASCIMPTYNRRPFIARAVACFLAQDYPSIELIVVDDGSDPIEDLLPDDSRIRYFRLHGKLTTGEKRNAACREARGEYILHWDDDDWYGPDRVSRQVALLRQSGAKVCGSTALYYYAPSTNKAFVYRYQGAVAAWMGALAYPAEVWRAQPFEPIQIAEDVKFLARIPAGARADMKDPALSVATIHESNTSPKMTTGAFWASENPAAVRALMQPPVRPPTEAMVSCIMPTWNRRAFIPLALECFRAQTYGEKELIVVDDGDDCVEDLSAGVPQVRYLRLNRKTSIGAKRNAACEAAQGAFIAHWDDDDWYSPLRLERQMEPLLTGSADLTGMTNSFILEMPAGQFWRTSAELHNRMFVGDIHGGTVAYRREVWQHFARYPDVNLAEDAALIRQATRAGKRTLPIDNRGEFVYLRHGRNSWQFPSGRFLDPAGWKRIAAPPGFTDDLLEAYRAASEAISAPMRREAAAASLVLR